MISCTTRFFSVLALLFFAVMLSNVSAQKENPFKRVVLKSQVNNKNKAGFWRISIGKASPLTFIFESKEAPISEILAALSKHLKIEFQASPIVQHYNATLSVPEATFETLLLQLAPFAIVEYEVSSAALQPQPLSVYLYAWNEQIPAPFTKRFNKTIGLLITGHTEEGASDAEAKRAELEAALPLFVKYESNQLTLRAKKQPPLDIGIKIAEELNIPFNVIVPTDEIVDVDINSMTPERAFQYLPSSLRLRTRVYLTEGRNEYVAITLDKQKTKN